MTTDEIIKDLDNLLFETKSKKVDEGEHPDVKRRWAIVHTELEKVRAYVFTYLEEKVAEEE